MLVAVPAVASAFTVNDTSIDSLAPGAIGPAIVSVLEPFGVNPVGAKSSTTILDAATVPWLNISIVKVIVSPG